MIYPPNFRFPVLDGTLFHLEWQKWLKALYDGDQGNEWTPTYSGLTESGTATHSGKYYRLSKKLWSFKVTITPATNTSSTAGTTVLNNFPLTISGVGSCIAVNNTTNQSIGSGVVNTTGIYPPSWVNVTAPITITGMVEVS